MMFFAGVALATTILLRRFYRLRRKGRRDATANEGLAAGLAGPRIEERPVFGFPIARVESGRRGFQLRRTPRGKSGQPVISSASDVVPAFSGQPTPREISAWQVEMLELTRHLTAEMETKAAVLRQLIREADAACQRLREAEPGWGQGPSRDDVCGHDDVKGTEKTMDLA